MDCGRVGSIFTNLQVTLRSKTLNNLLDLLLELLADMVLADLESYPTADPAKD